MESECNTGASGDSEPQKGYYVWSHFAHVKFLQSCCNTLDIKKQQDEMYLLYAKRTKNVSPKKFL